MTDIIEKNLFDFSTCDISIKKSAILKKNKIIFKSFNLLYPNIFFSTSEFLFFVRNLNHLDILFENMFCFCGNKNNFSSNKQAYNHHCSKACSTLDPKVKEKQRKTNLNKYGVENVMHNKEIKLKLEKNIFEKYGVSCVFENNLIKEKIKKTIQNIDFQQNKLEKVKKTNEKLYGVEYFFQTDIFKEKSINTLKERYNVDNASKSNIINEKKLATKRKNQTFNTSKDEEIIFLILMEKFKNVKRQYSDERYKFACDFYIEDIDLFIEYQGFPSHNYEPFDELNESHIQKLEELNEKSKKSQYFKTIVKVWTISDPKKRKIAKKNNLNWIEFFNINDFKNWIQKK